METYIKNAIRTRYWDGESLMALADEHHLALKSIEQLAATEGWGIARAMLDDLRSQLAPPHISLDLVMPIMDGVQVMARGGGVRPLCRPTLPPIP